MAAGLYDSQQGCHTRLVHRWLVPGAVLLRSCWAREDPIRHERKGVLSRSAPPSSPP